MLDHLSRGRLDVGIGRGVSPFELKFHKVEQEDSRNIFIDAYRCIGAGLTANELTYNGKYFAYEKVPMALRPLQQPHPPFWYASSNAVGATWAGEQGLHFITLGSVPAAKACIDAYRTALAKRGGPAQPKPEFPGGAVVGVSRTIFVADTDAEARRIGTPAWEAHVAHLNWLRIKVGDTGPNPRVVIPHGVGFDEAVAAGGIIAGSPQTVRAELERQVRALGVNYILSYLFIGTMSLAEALRSLRLFADEVMPHLEKL